MNADATPSNNPPALKIALDGVAQDGSESGDIVADDTYYLEFMPTSTGDAQVEIVFDGSVTWGGTHIMIDSIELESGVVSGSDTCSVFNEKKRQFGGLVVDDELYHTDAAGRRVAFNPTLLGAYSPTFNLESENIKLLEDAVAIFSGKRMYIGELGSQGLGGAEQAYWDQILNAALVHINALQIKDQEDISFAGWALGSNGGYNTATYGTLIYQGGATGIEYESHHSTIYENAFGSNILNGVNASGLEFGFAARLTDYGAGTQFSNVTHDIANIDDFVATVATYEDLIEKGVRTIRLPIRWERLEQDISDGATVAFDATYKALIDDAFDNLATANTNKGSDVKIILDIHNYGAYYDEDGVGTVTDRKLNDIQTEYNAFLKACVDEWAGHSAWRGFDIMNEPVNLTNAATWETVSQSAYNHLRSNGYTGIIIIETYPWAGIQDVPGNHSSPWITETGGADSQLVYSFHWYLGTNRQDSYKTQANEEADSTNSGLNLNNYYPLCA